MPVSAAYGITEAVRGRNGRAIAGGAVAFVGALAAVDDMGEANRFFRAAEAARAAAEASQSTAAEHQQAAAAALNTFSSQAWKF